jgi:prevent-host-death family protein
MALVYSTYEAKAKFSEIMRKVQSGQRVLISYRGKEVAEIRPLGPPKRSLEAAVQQWELQGVLAPPGVRKGKLGCVKKKPGALARFLESRD